jgi:hypothetical protein
MLRYLAFASALALAGAAHAALVVAPISGGPFSPANPLGTITSVDLNAANTYDFTFVLSGAGSVLTQMQASIAGPVSELIDFSLFSGAPGSGTLIDTSALMDGPSLTDKLGVGSYYLQVDKIAASGELLDGGLQVSSVPEAATWGLMLLGLAGVGMSMRAKAQFAV